LAAIVGCSGAASGCCRCLPDRKGSRIASYSEKILDDTVEGERPLSLAGRFESAICSPSAYLLNPNSNT